MMHQHDLHSFIKESNLIEGIKRKPTDEEFNEALRFMALDEVTVSDMQQFVKVYQPNAVLRDKIGLNVRVGNHLPPAGEPQIKTRLQCLLEMASDIKDAPREQMQSHAFEVHQEYEHLHPFTDGNGRSGRMLWAWMMVEFPLGFLHHWYYQSLSEWRQQ